MALILACGCSFTDKHGTRHTVIIGFGVVSVNQTNPVAATVTKINGIGLSTSSAPGMKLGLGYFNSVTVEVNTNNLLIEVSDAPGQPLKVQTP